MWVQENIQSPAITTVKQQQWRANLNADVSEKPGNLHNQECTKHVSNNWGFHTKA